MVIVGRNAVQQFDGAAGDTGDGAVEAVADAHVQATVVKSIKAAVDGRQSVSDAEVGKRRGIEDASEKVECVAKDY